MKSARTISRPGRRRSSRTSSPAWRGRSRPPRCQTTLAVMCRVAPSARHVQIRDARVSGESAWLAAPPQAAPPTPPATASDPAATSALSAQLPAFFQAYASGDSAMLNRFLAPGATVSAWPVP